MDCPYCITDAEKRKKGKHLTDIDRGIIQALNREGMSLRKIAGHIGCSPSTVLNELRRGTPPRKSNRDEYLGTLQSVAAKFIKPTAHIHVANIE